MSKKPLPPYGKELQEKLNANQIPANGVWLFLGPNAWRYAKNHYFNGKSVLVLPEDKSPNDYVWPVQKTSVLILDLHANDINVMLIKRLAWQLLAAGAQMVFLLWVWAGKLIKFYPDNYSSNCENNNVTA